jgi:hypothetical protein
MATEPKSYVFTLPFYNARLTFSSYLKRALKMAFLLKLCVAQQILSSAAIRSVVKILLRLDLERKISFFRASIIVGSLLAFSGPWEAQADSTDTSSQYSVIESFQVHGFLSQAVVNTSDNRWFGDSPDTSYAFTEAALNGSARILPQLLISGQVLLRQAGDMYDGSPSLDYALADLTFASTFHYRLGMRGGRIKNPFGLYNETRDVPFTRPGIFLPQVVYFDRVRNLVLSSDGMMAYADTFQDYGDVSLIVGGGWPVMDENVEWSYLGADFPGDLESDSPLIVGRLWYSSPNASFNMGLSGTALRMRFDPDVGAPFTLSSGTTDIFYWIASLQYNSELWTISAEYMREPLEWKDYGEFFPNQDFTSEGWYIQAQYRAHPQLELMMRWEEGYADLGDRDGTKLERVTGGAITAYSRYSNIFTAGARFDISQNWMVRAEYSYHDGTFILSPRENPIPRDQEKYWHAISFLLAFRF